MIKKDFTRFSYPLKNFSLIKAVGSSQHSPIDEFLTFGKFQIFQLLGVQTMSPFLYWLNFTREIPVFPNEHLNCSFSRARSVVVSKGNLFYPISLDNRLGDWVVSD